MKKGPVFLLTVYQECYLLDRKDEHRKGIPNGTGNPMGIP